MCSCGRDNAVHDRSDIEPGDPEDDCCTISRSRREQRTKAKSYRQPLWPRLGRRCAFEISPELVWAQGKN